MELKEKCVQEYKQLVDKKINEIQNMIADLTIDAQNDAKGSAGDKHETALAMMHLEQEKLNQKLKEFIQQKEVLSRIDASQKHSKVALGSVVQANEMLFFMSAALPKITIDDKSIIAVSPQSPLGSKLMGNKAGFKFEMGIIKYTISEVL